MEDPFGGWSTTTLPPPGSEDTGTIADDRPGFFDFAGKVRRAVNGWFRGLVEDALEPVLNLVGRTILSTPDFTGPGRVRDLWLVSWGIANGIFVLFILAAGVIGMGYESLQSRYAIKELLPRLALAFVGANTSLFLGAPGPFPRRWPSRERRDHPRATTGEPGAETGLEPVGEARCSSPSRF